MSNILTNNINPRSGNVINIGGINDKVSIAGTLSYEDVTNIDSVGVITARQGVHYGDVGSGVTITAVGTGTSLGFLVNDSERVRIDSNGRLLVGTTIALDKFGSDKTPRFQVEGTTLEDSSISITRWNSANTTTPTLFFGGTNSSTSGVYTLVDNDEALGQISFEGTDGSKFVPGATITAAVDGTPGADDMPGRLVFSTNSGQSSTTERMRIDSTGRLLVGLTSAMTTGSNDLRDTIQAVHTAGAQLLLGRNDSTAASTNRLGEIAFLSNDNSGGFSYEVGASIRAEFDETPNDGDKPTAIAFKNCSNGSSTLTERMRVDSSGRLLVGTNSALADDTKNSWYSYFQIKGNTADTDGRMVLATTTASGDVASGVDIGNIYFLDSSGGEYASIKVEGDGGAGTDDYPGRIVFSTTAGSSPSPTERFRIDRRGFTQQQSITSAMGIETTQAASTAFNLILGRYGATTGSLGTGTISFQVHSNGDVKNTNDSYGVISDIKLKENIVDAESQWDDFKAVRFRKYNFKEETGHETHTQLGVIAQELELVSPGLVYETPDLDEEGNDLGTTTKAVKSSILVKKALVALQEAMERIETLETQNADLLTRVSALEG